jgi:hypothetical protein
VALLGFSLKASEKMPHSFVKNMFKLDVAMEFFYSKTMESFLCIIIRNHGYRESWRKLNG